MKKVLVLNISTDSKDTSLGFAISWVNALSINYDNVDVITLYKGCLLYTSDAADE